MQVSCIGISRVVGLDMHMWGASQYVPYVWLYVLYTHVKLCRLRPNLLQVISENTGISHTTARRFFIQYESEFMEKILILENNAQKVNFEDCWTVMWLRNTDRIKTANILVARSHSHWLGYPHSAWSTSWWIRCGASILQMPSFDCILRTICGMLPFKWIGYMLRSEMSPL